MKVTTRSLGLLACLLVASMATHAQQVTLFGKNVQVHGFASQGFAYSNDNNYLTMKTSSGSFAFTDFGFTASTQITDKFRVGAQFYDRNVGQLGNYHPEIDWAMGDYKFKDWFGIRAGKVKTVLGLYNDTQDMEFLHTWALMPQSTYPVDVRGDTIAHVGGDLYGNISTKRLGSFSYTVYGGTRQNDSQGGYLYGLSTSSRVADPNGGFKYILSQTKNIDHYGGPVYGADLRWTTPINGLLIGASYMRQTTATTGFYLAPTKVEYKMDISYNPTNAFYVEYAIGKLKLAGEYRKEVKLGAFNAPTGARIIGNENARSGYGSAAYRFSKWLELGTYHSRYVANWDIDHSDPRNHISDQTVSARMDLNRYLDLKVEGHFIHGAMINSSLDRGFYAAPNPSGLKPNMNMLVMRLGFHI